MINLYDQVPLIYTNASRDFQYLCWLANVVLNSVKHNVDDLYNVPSTKINAKLTELLAMTLGFRVRRNYNQEQLAALVKIFPRIMKYKGTELAIRMAGEALITASGSTAIFDCEIDGTVLKVVLPKERVDTTLFIDVLPYILPAGMTCQIVRKTLDGRGTTSTYHHKDTLCASWIKDVVWDEDTQTISGLAAMASGTDDSLFGEPSFTNFDRMQANNPNIGLADNTIIPLLHENDTVQWKKPKATDTTNTDKEE